MAKEIDKRVLLQVLGYIDELVRELFFLQEKNFPLQQTDLFCKKCMHFAQVLEVNEPVFLGPKAESASVFVLGTDFMEENFLEYHNWLLGLKYRFWLLSELSPRQISKIKRYVELSIPSVLKIGVEDA